MDQSLFGNLIEVLSGLLIFSLGIPAFILQSMFPESLRPLMWRVKRFTIAPVLLLSAGYLYALLCACLGAQSSSVSLGDLKFLVWLSFGLVVLNAMFFLFLCAVPPLDAARWLFKRRVMLSKLVDKRDHFEDFMEISMILASKRDSLILHRDFRQILKAFLSDIDYMGNSLDRFFGNIKELFLLRGFEGARITNTVNFILTCCREVMEANRSKNDPERANCSDVALAWESVELMAIALVEQGSLLDFRRSTDFLEGSIERLSRVLWVAAEHRSSLKFASCLNTLGAVLERERDTNTAVKARLCAIYAKVDQDPSWVSEGVRRQLGRILELHSAILKGMSADEVVARVRGDAGLKVRITKILKQLQSGRLLKSMSG